ncbi:polysaccharide biosynthesis protein [Cellulophaga algicola DSM 14237]|uniref:Polysaccharide biosynthesis protein n=1 Tax=Cellulophaga algicola (strain DSM 14237 / IC166 / ACAM 630) TaxID=688270 RepID=E6XB35_CELAD|nr:flippase [Cellulophaga algicola]ADV48891.1 polysaccharide biosynthesis protein [Cellulophaga algicola DSM 14237]
MKKAKFSNIGKDKKVVLKNAGFLTIMQATNHLLPLMVLPYLSRILGPEKFGVIFFAQIFINYFMILSDYGFNFIGVRQIAQNRGNKKELNNIVSSIYNLRVLFGIIGFVILYIVVSSFSRFQEDKMIYFYTYGMVIGNILLPTWFFQGIEKMKYITILNFISKLGFTISIFFLINTQQDYIYVPLLNSVGYILSGIIGIGLLYKKYNISIFLVKWNRIKDQLKNGFSVFVSNLSITAYTSTNAFILGNMVSNDIMGYYGGAEKIIQPFKFLFSPIYNATYPYFSGLVVKNKSKALKEMKWGVFSSLIIGTILFVLILTFSEEIITLVLGKEFLSGLDIFYVFSILILITPVSYFLFNVVFLSLSLEKYSMKIYLFGGIFNIFILLGLIYFMGSPAIAAALSNVLTQVLNLVLASIVLINYLKKE